MVYDSEIRFAESQVLFKKLAGIPRVEGRGSRGMNFQASWLHFFERDVAPGNTVQGSELRFQGSGYRRARSTPGYPLYRPWTKPWQYVLMKQKSQEFSLRGVWCKVYGYQKIHGGCVGTNIQAWVFTFCILGLSVQYLGIGFGFRVQTKDVLRANLGVGKIRNLPKVDNAGIFCFGNIWFVSWPRDAG